MARTTITPALTLLAKETLNVVANARDLAAAAGDAVLGNAVVCTGKELVFVTNTDAGDPHSITFTAIDDSIGRGGTLVYAVGASEMAVLGPFAVEYFKQSADGMLYIDVDDAQLEIAVIRLG